MQQSDRGGWRITGQYMLDMRDAHNDFDYQLPPVGQEPDYSLMANHTWYKFVLVMPDGSEHELRPVDYTPFSGSMEFLFGYYYQTPYNTGTMRYYSYDGSFIYATVTASGDWTAYLPDGTRVMQTSGIQRIQDTNGNKIKIFSDSQGTHYQDELTGREIRYFYNPTGNNNNGQGQVWYQTVNGVWMHIDINFGNHQVQGKLYTVNGWISGQLNPRPCTYQRQLSQSIQVVDEIVLPQTEPTQPSRRFSFYYNSDATESATNNMRLSCSGSAQPYTRDASKGWGAVSKMITPAGAEIDYAYALDSGAIDANFVFSPDEIPGETITKKTLVHDGATDVWNYQILPDMGSASQTYAADNSVVSENSYPQMATLGSGYGGGYYAVSGLVYRTTKPFQKIERHWTNLIFTGAALNSPGGTVVFNPVVDAEYTTLTDANGNALKMSAKAFQYDYNGNVLQTTDYDWFDPNSVSRDSNGVPTAIPLGATVLRVTNNTLYNGASSASSANVYAKRPIATGAPLILNAVQQTTSGPAIAQFSYDNQAYGVAPTLGNLTSKKLWDDLDSKWITTGATYDAYGNVLTTTDGRGKVTQLVYGDTTHALPTSVTVDPQNGSGTQTTQTAYDTSTGLVTSQTDANLQVSSIDYTNQLLGTVDPFGRPGIAKAPAINGQQRRVTTTYIDSARQVIIASDLNAENDKLLKTRTTTDSLGRPVLTEQTEDGTNYTISVHNAYLNMGSVTLTSSAMRSTAANTDSWTRITKDTGGRVTEVATFGGATQPAWSGTSGVFTGTVTTSYDAQFTTVTDQVGKVRRSMVDGLGRFIRDDEPDANGSLGATSSPVQPTNYVYDVFGNLITVTQGTQTRTFTYDSLSRLRTAVNPESGTVTYQYDDNGNLLVKTDARGVSTHFDYDSLNRVTRRWYNGSNSVSYTQNGVPSLPQGVGATNEVKFYYDSQLPLQGTPPTYTHGPSVGRLTAQIYGSAANGDYYAYDVVGRQTLKLQQTGSINYQVSATYSLSGATTTLTYPSGHTVTNTYDSAGRLSALSGNLGDGTTRTYATGILYSPLGGLVKEQFGTTTPVYNKLFYNSRGQVAEIRASTSYTGPTDYDANRGAIINSYSSQCTGLCSGSTMTDNNGNLLQQDIQIPSAQTRSQYYTYDTLNRLKSAREVMNSTEQWKQQFTYDRWGNRLIDNANTYGTGINNLAFEKQDATNRLFAPGDVVLGDGSPQRKIDYDQAGNQTKDIYTGYGTANYDGENRITTIQNNQSGSSTYAYDGSGQRIKRTTAGVETWQVYGFGGELLAEYSANGAATSPQKEYGYRNGQLLVTATGAPRVNVAAAANGGIATASETNSAPYAPAGAINGDRKLYANNAWANSTATFPQWLEVDFNGSKVIDELDVFSIQDNAGSPSEPTLTMTFSLYGLTTFAAQYWDGLQWVTVPGGSITGNNKVWKQISFSAVTTTKIRIWITGSSDGYSRLAEIEAWGTSAPVTRQNVAASANGGAATASETNSAPYAPAGAINGERKLYANNAWANSTATFPQWLEVDFNGSKDIDEIDVFSIQDNAGSPSEPTPSMTFSLYGLTAFQAQYWNGSAWTTVPNGSISGNNLVWKQITFSTISTTKIRIWITGSSDGYSRMAEVEAWGVPTGSSTSNVEWLITDHLGTPRMVLDQTGSLANMKRHDYLPFGEELFAPTGGRTVAQGYAGDGIRQHFTSKERDVETGLDYFEARYYGSTQGRFTSIDPYNVVMERQFATDAKKAESQFTVYLSNPQRWARYTYALNNPLLYTDPHGEDVTIYYRPPEEGAGSKEDYGHIFIYVRNDETGESAYYDYIATGDYNNFGTTQLNGVDQKRIDRHASITIETTASQEQAILDGIKAAQQSSPDYSVSPSQALTHRETTCTSNAIKLLALGGINVGPSIMPQTPTAVWQSAFEQYGNKDANRATVPAPQPRFPGRTREIINGYDNRPQVNPGREYGRDPRGQARVLDRNATNNYTINFRGGQRVP